MRVACRSVRKYQRAGHGAFVSAVRNIYKVIAVTVGCRHGYRVADVEQQSIDETELAGKI